jgi:hypothetical protein
MSEVLAAKAAGKVRFFHRKIDSNMQQLINECLTNPGEAFSL